MPASDNAGQQDRITSSAACEAAASTVEYAVRFDVTRLGEPTRTTTRKVPWPDQASREAALREVARLTDCADDIKRDNFRVLRREISPWTEVEAAPLSSASPPNAEEVTI